MKKDIIKAVLKEIALENPSVDPGNHSPGNALEKGADFYVENPEVLSDWVGIRRHSMAPCEKSYRKVGDMFIMNPELIRNVIRPILDATGATCPVSAAKAAADILELLDQSEV